MRVVGLISGTSHDAVDAAVVDFEQEQETLLARVIGTSALPYPRSLRELLSSALPPAKVGMDVVCELDTRIGAHFAEAAVAAMDATGGADLVASHGQTVYHWIDGDGRARGGLQLGQPAWIAERTGCPVVSDLRSADIAAGGQGAPLVAMMDEWLLAGVGERPVAVNLGGIANISVPTVVGRAGSAYDIGPANALMDAVAVRASDGHVHYDEGGRLAGSGRVVEDVLEALLREPYYARPAPKSTGKELFHAEYLNQVPGLAAASVPDQAATLMELTARTVAQSVVDARADVAVFAGGGVRNPVLMKRIADLLDGVRVLTSDAVGVDADSKEAVLFAMLGWCTWHGVPGVLPAYTGAGRAAVLGSVTPGPGRPGSWPVAADPRRPRIERLTVLKE